MFKEATLLFLHAETGLHAGSGQALGAIDLAIQRERYTDYPIIAASGVKGALRDWFSRKYPPQPNGEGKLKPHPNVAAIFGPDTENASDHAGAATTTDARVLLFPVRTARGVFAWTTSPMVLARLRRDLALTGEPDSLPTLPPFPKDDGDKERDDVVFGSSTCGVKDEQGVLLEEYAFAFEPSESGFVGDLADWILEHALPEGGEYRFWRENLAARLLVLPDVAFRDFVVHATEVQARVKLGEGKSTAPEKKGNLFYQENLPADTLVYAAILAGDDRSGHMNGPDSSTRVLQLLRELDGQRIQIGGDETIGKGICCACFLPNPSDA